MKENYQYPLDFSWTAEELLIVVAMFNAVEDVYEKGLAKNIVEKRYAAFKTVVKSIGEEKKLDREFQAQSNYSLYQVAQLLKKSDKKILKLEVR
ncbi:UPF0223 family protein [Enterococcus timonensis]|uniref:UPF0223 family protein n=1 Tax=Enterococcus timonensis TaxID=1852364 RepID=UPI0008DA70A9|nr:UPF0223 family protein [Enterococcus timonensis]